MKTVLITGSNGLLGQKLCERFENLDNYTLIATSLGEQLLDLNKGTYLDLDITSSDAVSKAFKTYQPDVVINSAAMTHVDKCETDKDLCDKINVHGVQNLIDSCKVHGAKLIHISTDFIFDGENGPYAENDTANPIGYYGLSKWKAENAISDSGIDYAIARTMLLFGVISDPNRSNIILWARKALLNDEVIRIVNDQVRSPTLAEDLADGILRIVVQNASGVFHISGPESMTMVELVRRLAKYWNLKDQNIQEIETFSLNQAAKRPPITGFDIRKATSELGYEPRELEEALALVAEQLKEHKLA